jgi:hypothetical protein
MQSVMKTHLSQPAGIGALVGQHGISSAIPSAVADMAVSSAIADIDASEGAAAITGWAVGAKTSPAIMKIASNRRMVIWQSTAQKSHKTARMDSPPRLTTP